MFFAKLLFDPISFVPAVSLGKTTRIHYTLLYIRVYFEPLNNGPLFERIEVSRDELLSREPYTDRRRVEYKNMQMIHTRS